ncbi:hypothetical protein MKK68_26850 [Methylobacterium sp. E-016]|uniref:hypothetical protein n=1 Tax=Methylobacterium sp. E-016 TaxID=2836556 RepID=UPI001FBB3BB0|nr:hypothetical protein [Methylobacterium sp. E-016]MCJ2079206.1 hypothetical protein [Methylobacterium sp. E-016]
MSSSSRDDWSPSLIATYSAIMIVFMITPGGNSAITVSLIFLLILASIIAFVWFWYDLFRWRLRHALSIIIAVTAVFGIGYYAPLLQQSKDKIDFKLRQAGFEQQVEDARSKQTAQEPLQIVVDYEDQSVFVTANSFYYILYDETDGTGPYKGDFWPFTASPTGTISVGTPKYMQHLTGHFYSFRSSY